jgi:hypothetical protein
MLISGGFQATFKIKQDPHFALACDDNCLRPQRPKVIRLLRGWFKLGLQTNTSSLPGSGSSGVRDSQSLIRTAMNTPVE